MAFIYSGCACMYCTIQALLDKIPTLFYTLSFFFHSSIFLFRHFHTSSQQMRYDKGHRYATTLYDAIKNPMDTKEGHN